MGREGNQLGIMQEIEIWPSYKIVYAKNSLGFWDTNRSLNPGQETRLSDSRKKERKKERKKK